MTFRALLIPLALVGLVCCVSDDESVDTSVQRNRVHGQSQPCRKAEAPATSPLDTEEAEAEDQALVAERSGLTPAQVAAEQEASEVVGHLAEQVGTVEPQAFLGSALDPRGGPPRLLVKGGASAFVRQLVASAPIEVALVDEQPYSHVELELRSDAVHKALLAQGYREVVTSSDIDGRGAIKATVRHEVGLSEDRAEILSRVPEALRATVDLTISYERDVVTLEKDDDTSECTSG
jgi:hypothetical protein